MHSKLLALILLAGCYSPAPLSVDDDEFDVFAAELAECDATATRSCLLIDETFRSVDCGSEPEPANSDNRLWCDWSGCRDTLAAPLYDTTIAPDCYDAACPGHWHARAAYQKCDRDLSDDEFEADYVGCMRMNGCGSADVCILEQTEASLAAFKLSTFECAIELSARIRG